LAYFNIHELEYLRISAVETLQNLYFSVQEHVKTHRWTCTSEQMALSGTGW